MKKYLVKLKSVTELVLNTPQKELFDELKALPKDQLNEWEENEKNWRRKAERDKKGNVILPPRWFKTSFTDACKYTRMVPHFATSKKETYTRYSDSLIFSDTTFVCSMESPKYYGAFVGAQGKNSKTKRWCVRPMVEKWETDLTIIDPFGRMKIEELQELLEYSGMLLGVGDARKLNYGRFKVVSIKEIK